MSAADIRLVPMTVRLLDAEEQGSAALAEALGVAAPPSWPPMYNDAATRAWVRRSLAEVPDWALWPSSYIVAFTRTEQGKCWVLAGTAGFKGPPDADGIAEIGYSVVEAFWRRGIATQAARDLVEQARARGAKAACAHTLVGDKASGGVLLKCGFRDAGVVEDPNDGPVRRFEIVFDSA